MSYKIDYYKSRVSYNYYAIYEGVIYRFHDNDDMWQTTFDADGYIFEEIKGSYYMRLGENDYMDMVQYVKENMVPGIIPDMFIQHMNKTININTILDTL